MWIFGAEAPIFWTKLGTINLDRPLTGTYLTGWRFQGPNLSMDLAAYFFAGFEALASKPRYVFNSAVAFFASPDFTASFAASISLSMFGTVWSNPLESHVPSSSAIFFAAPFISLAVTSLSASWANVWYGFRSGVVACCAARRVDVRAQSIAQTATARNACFRKLRVNMCILRSYLSGISILAQCLAHRTPLLPPLQRISQRHEFGRAEQAPATSITFQTLGKRTIRASAAKTFLP